MAKRKPRDKNKPRKIKVPPVPNSGPVKYNVWFMPEVKEVGNHDKWGEPTEIVGKNRKTVAKQVREQNHGKIWKLRLV